MSFTCFKESIGFQRQNAPGRKMHLDPKYTHRLGVIKLNRVCLDYLLPISLVTCTAVTPAQGGQIAYCKCSGVYYSGACKSNCSEMSVNVSIINQNRSSVVSDVKKLGFK